MDLSFEFNLQVNNKTKLVTISNTSRSVLIRILWNSQYFQVMDILNSFIDINNHSIFVHYLKLIPLILNLLKLNFIFALKSDFPNSQEIYI